MEALKSEMCSVSAVDLEENLETDVSHEQKLISEALNTECLPRVCRLCRLRAALDVFCFFY